MCIQSLSPDQAIQIAWKSDEMNLCQKYPRTKVEADIDPEDDDIQGDMGSFFYFFTEKHDPLSVRDIKP